jgi:pimeloyl-ACP methyl ester carboxylesterase
MNVDLGDVTLHVRDQGSGSPVVLLHGWPDTSDLWRHQVSALTAAGYRVIAPDLRGFGGSGKPADLAAYTAPVLIGDVVGLLDALGIQRAHLVGHDWGAAVAWWTAALVPDRVASMTALSVGHPASFRPAGWRQRQKSWYMLLFQFAGIAVTRSKAG